MLSSKIPSWLVPVEPSLRVFRINDGRKASSGVPTPHFEEMSSTKENPIINQTPSNSQPNSPKQKKPKTVCPRPQSMHVTACCIHPRSVKLGFHVNGGAV